MKPAPYEPKPLNLPRTMPDGSTTTRHPLVWCLRNRMPEGKNKSDLARFMRVRPQSLYKWEKLAREDRNFSLPLERAMEIAAFCEVHPVLFRPDAPWGVTLSKGNA